MCQKCQDAIDEFFPDASEQEVSDILLSKTAWPFGSAHQIKRQLKEYSEDPDAVDRAINAMFSSTIDPASEVIT